MREGEWEVREESRSEGGGMEGGEGGKGGDEIKRLSTLI